ncbi:MAG: DNA-directed RNA polymerase subunit H [Methanobacteriaceae archaeon]|nr:DNA-directed RNA polymerase subunit H [Methanobacteriaceae archaeon]
MKKDILKHELVPDHVILSESEVTKVLKKIEAHAEQLPKINSDDPVAKSIGAKAGDVLEITRKSATAGKFITYRLVQD